MPTETLITLYQRRGITGLYRKIDYAIDTEENDREIAEVSEGGFVFRFGEKVIAVLGPADVFQALDAAEAYLYRRGFHYWLDEVLPLFRRKMDEN